MNRRRLVIAAVCVLATVALSSCASTKLVDLWRDPSFTAVPMKNVLVIAMKKDATRRRLWEDGLVGPLSRHSLTATPSYLLFPNALPDTQQVVEAVRARGFDGVIVVSRLPNETAHAYVPGTVETRPVTVYDPWRERYQRYLVEEQRPGTVETQKVIRHRVELWTTKEGGRVVWTATGKSVDPGSAQQVNRELAQEIVPQMAKQKLIPPQAR